MSQEKKENENDQEKRRKLEKPQLMIDEVGAIVQELFGLTIDPDRTKELDSYDDRNFFVCTLGESPTCYTVKVHNGVESDNRTELNAQNLILTHLQDNGVKCCSPVQAKNGELLAYTQLTLKDGRPKQHAVRLLNWVHGKTMHDIVCTLPIFERAGEYLGALTHTLKDFDHPGFHRQHSWDLVHTLQIRGFVKHVEGDENQQLVNQVLDRFESHVKPAIDSNKLRRSVIQGDYNDANVIVDSSGGVSGVIDFGDSVYTCIVNELAIAIAYMFVNVATKEGGACTQQQLFDAGGAFYTGFAKKCTMSEEELNVLPTLIACRLAMSCTYGAFSIAQDPNNEYLRLHAVPAWSALRLYWSASVEEIRSAMFTA